MESFGSAAKQLGLTQPAVSKIINDIESNFGIELMVRKNTGVTLTSAGQVLLVTRSPSLVKNENMVNEMNSLSCSSVG
ncbi:HTH-type transcriptional regulator AbgR [Kluyvera cryocrescens]|uniref:HTH-type transcriptional regulator AbgR n=1 Tax=Kluyvera cryocrescens TaxID=580 RepID=A0A485AHA9_KLUCR|nr:HTH-type transcriptional regulator AbgR [Kluyvera cryocrescens]